MSNRIDNNLTDKELVGRVLNGNIQAFGAIIKSTEGLVAQIVFKMISNIEDRKDIAQDIYLKAFHKLSGFRFQSRLSTWIGQIAYNTCLNYLEKKKLFLTGEEHQYEERDDEVPMPGNRSLQATTHEAESFIFREELSAILQTEIENLPPVYKTLITLYHNEELSYEEITRITGLPEGTVKNYLFRARRTLKRNLLSKYKKEEL